MRRRETGMTLVETVVAMLVLAVGILGTLLALDGSRGLTGVSESRTALAHRAQAELERIRGLGFAGIAMDAAPVREAATAALLTTDDPPRLRPDRRDPTTVEDLVVDPGRGLVPAAVRRWSDGRTTGTLRAWVSEHPDGACGADCAGSGSTRRVTVAVTDDRDPARGPVVSSVLVADPTASPAGMVVDGTRHPLEDPSIACAAPDGSTATCTRSITTGSATSWFLYDTPASRSTWAAVTGDHAVDRTVAPVGVCLLALLSDCPVPDLMGDEPPAAPDVLPPLLDRSVDLPGSAGSGGRVLQRGTRGCGDPPPDDNRMSQRWVTPVLPDDLQPTGDGGMTLWSRTASATAARVTLCLQLAVAPGPVRELLGLPPAILATVSYTLASWPGVTTPVSFSFDLAGAVAAVPAGRRLAARIWVAASSSDDLVVAYDHPAVTSALQVNVR